MAISLFIGNLNYNTSEEELLALLEPFGFTISISIIKDKYTLKSKGFAHCNVQDKECAEKIIKNLNGQLFKERVIRIELFNK